MGQKVSCFAKTHLLTLIPPNMIKTTQACICSIQTSSKGINQIAEDTLAHINFLTINNNDPMVIIQVKASIQQPPRKILQRAAAYDTVRKRTVLPLHETKIEFMMIIKQNKLKLANEGTATRRNPDSTSGI